jgi:cardiolipin synthase
MEGSAPRNYLTIPNAFTLLRLCCLPLFLYLLLGRDNRAGAAWLLGALGATDWVDGWLARRLNQTSEFGKAFDPTTDRLLFIVGITGIIIDGSAPLWFSWLVVVRELVVGGAIATATVAFGMKRFDVQWLGKTATLLLMFSFPAFMLSESDFPLQTGFRVVAWGCGIPGLVLSYYTAIRYVPLIRDGVRTARRAHESHEVVG